MQKGNNSIKVGFLLLGPLISFEFILYFVAELWIALINSADIINGLIAFRGDFFALGGLVKGLFFVSLIILFVMGMLISKMLSLVLGIFLPLKMPNTRIWLIAGGIASWVVYFGSTWLAENHATFFWASSHLVFALLLPVGFFLKMKYGKKVQKA